MTQVFRCHSTFYIKKITGVFCDIFTLIVFSNLCQHINTLILYKGVNLLLFWQHLIGVVLICQNSQFHNYPRLHEHIQKGGECRLNAFFSKLDLFRLNLNFRNIPKCLVIHIFAIIFSNCSFHFAFW